MENSPKELQNLKDTMLDSSDDIVDHLTDMHQSIYNEHVHPRVSKLIGENGANGLRSIYHTGQKVAEPIAKIALKQMITKKFNSPIQNGSGRHKSHKDKSHKDKSHKDKSHKRKSHKRKSDKRKSDKRKSHKRKSHKHKKN